MQSGDIGNIKATSGIGDVKKAITPKVNNVVKEDATVDTFGTTDAIISKEALKQPVVEKKKTEPVAKEITGSQDKSVSFPTFITNMDIVNGSALLEKTTGVKGIGPNNLPKNISKMYIGATNLP